MKNVQFLVYHHLTNLFCWQDSPEIDTHVYAIIRFTKEKKAIIDARWFDSISIYFNDKKKFSPHPKSDYLSVKRIYDDLVNKKYEIIKSTQLSDMKFDDLKSHIKALKNIKTYEEYIILNI